MGRKILIGLVIMMHIVSFAGCSPRYVEYPFLQDLSEATQINICECDEETKELTSIKMLNKVEMASIWADILALKCDQTFGDYPTAFGRFVVHISYKDGSSEILGFMNTAQIKADGKQEYTLYSFNPDEFHAMIEKYLGTELQ